jgi:hypothetical protein
MKITIRDKLCPGCQCSMKATEVLHRENSRLVHITWRCVSCERSFCFTYIQDTDELPKKE